MLSIVVLILALPTMAAAQSIGPTDGQYDPRNQQVGGNVSGGDPSTASNSSLPFTGLDAIVMLSVGGALLAGGLVIRLAARSD